MDMESVKEWIDVEDALNRIKGNKVILKTLLKSYMKNNYMDQLAGEVHAGNLEEAAKTAHTIKGVSANLSLVKVNTIVVLLEAQLKSGFPSEESLAELQTAVAETTQCLETLVESL